VEEWRLAILALHALIPIKRDLELARKTWISILKFHEIMNWDCFFFWKNMNSIEILD
jgi:hypothetical protein